MSPAPKRTISFVMDYYQSTLIDRIIAEDGMKAADWWRNLTMNELRRRELAIDEPIKTHTVKA